MFYSCLQSLGTFFYSNQNILLADNLQEIAFFLFILHGLSFRNFGTEIAYKTFKEMIDIQRGNKW
tara:strand:- start:18 stop:212 length:195 start_codon:yes stop_codon:yes gene_type:complete